MSGHVLYENPKEPWQPYGHLSVPTPPPGEPDLVRLDQSAFYAPGLANPSTDAEGFLPHDGGDAPPWAKGRRVRAKLRCGEVVELLANGALWPWPRVYGTARQIVGYKIVGDQGTKHVGPRPSSDARKEILPDPGLSNSERRHRNELAARTLTPVPGMDDFMHDVLREARRFEYRKAALIGSVTHTHGCSKEEHARKHADAMIEAEYQERLRANDE